MREFYVEEVAHAMSGKVVGDKSLKINSISKDSRDVGPDSLFFAIKGDRFDGHDFLTQVFGSGAPAAVVERISGGTSGTFIIVEDTIKALQDFSEYYLKTVNPKRIAITGSTGKTSTKDMLFSILEKKFKSAKNIGNLNNEIGVPISILSAEPEVDVVVLEMGMDKPGEIRRLSDIVRPNIAIITNIGLSHIENFESQKGILNAKLEITEFFDSSSKLIVYNDDELLKEIESEKYQVISVGTTGKSDYIISGVEDRGDGSLGFHIEHENEIVKYKLPISGRHNAINATLAVAAAGELGVTLEESSNALETLRITDKRLNIKVKDGLKVIDDTYNASPDSMKAALDVLHDQGGIRKIAILGDMFELGKSSKKYHKDVGKYAAELELDYLIAIGDNSSEIAKGARGILGKEKIKYFESKDKAIDEIKSLVQKGDVVLVKGSRGMQMEEIVEVILGC